MSVCAHIRGVAQAQHISDTLLTHASVTAALAAANDVSTVVSGCSAAFQRCSQNMEDNDDDEHDDGLDEYSNAKLISS